MKTIKVTREFENPLFGRREVEVFVTSEISPKKTEAEKFLSEKFSANPDSIRVKKIEGKFGSNHFKIIANIYNSKEKLQSIEVFSKKEVEKRKKAQEAEKVAANANVERSNNEISTEVSN